MGRAVIIVHPSEIVRRGLLSVFEEQQALRLISLSDLSMLDSVNLGHVSSLILLVPASCEKSDRLHELRTRVADHLFIGLGEQGSSKEYLFDHVVPLNAPIAQLTAIANHFLKAEEKNLNEELTGREKEVLQLIALGYTNKAIAQQLFISMHTVISHRKNITDKLGIKSIPGLTVYAIIQKIIDPSDISPDQLL